MKFPSIKSLSEGTLSTIKRFPFELLFALCAAIAGTAWAKNHDYGSIYKDNCARIMMVANLGLLLSLAASLYTESKGMDVGKKFLLKSVAAIVSVSFYWLLDPFDLDYDMLRFFLLSFSFHLLVAFAAFTRKGQVQGFWQFNKTLFLRFLAAMLYSGVLYVGLVAAILATKYLFNVHWNDDIYLILWVWISCIFNSIFFLAGVPADFNALDEDTSYPKALKIFTQYVLIPLATIYVIILLAYEVKILIEWRLPKGYVSNLILGYAVFGILAILLVHPIREHAENKWLKIYSRYFYFLLIPLIVLLFLAMFARVLPYGITPQRYLLVMLAAWLLVITLYFLLSKKQSIKIIPISLCLLTLLSTYGPQNAFRVSNWSQTHILVSIFKKYNAFHEGKLQPVTKKMTDKDGTNAAAKLYYLTENDAWDMMQPYIADDLKHVNDSLTNKANHNKQKQAFSYMSRYSLRSKKFSWLKTRLGLKNFSQYGPDTYNADEDLEEIQQYHLSVENEQPLRVKGSDYVLRINHIYGGGQDTSEDKPDHIRFIMINDNNNTHSLSINNEKVSFDLKDLIGKLVGPNAQKKYKESIDNSYEKRYTLPDSLLTFSALSPTYQVTLKVNDLILRMSKDETTITEMSGYYLVKKK